MVSSTYNSIGKMSTSLGFRRLLSTPVDVVLYKLGDLDKRVMV